MPSRSDENVAKSQESVRSRKPFHAGPRREGSDREQGEKVEQQMSAIADQKRPDIHREAEETAPGLRVTYRQYLKRNSGRKALKDAYFSSAICWAEEVLDFVESVEIWAFLKSLR